MHKRVAEIFTDRSSSEDGKEKEANKTIEASTGYYCKHEDKWMYEVGSGGEIKCAQCYRRVVEIAGVCQQDGAQRTSKTKWIDIDKDEKRPECRSGKNETTQDGQWNKMMSVGAMEEENRDSRKGQRRQIRE